MNENKLGFVEAKFVKIVGRDPGSDSPYEVWALVEFPNGLKVIAWDPELILFGHNTGDKILIKLRGEYGEVAENDESRQEIVPTPPGPGSGYGGYIFAYGKVLSVDKPRNGWLTIALDVGIMPMAIDCKKTGREVKPGDFLKINCLLSTDYDYYLKLARRGNIDKNKTGKLEK